MDLTKYIVIYTEGYDDFSEETFDTLEEAKKFAEFIDWKAYIIKGEIVERLT